MMSFGSLPPLCAAHLKACLQSSQAHINENFGDGSFNFKLHAPQQHEIVFFSFISYLTSSLFSQCFTTSTAKHFSQRLLRMFLASKSFLQDEQVIAATIV
jgi:hypothetical protein